MNNKVLGINHFLKLFREKRNLSIDKAADLLGISESELTDIENNKFDYSTSLEKDIDLIKKFVEVYVMSLQYFVFDYNKEFNEEALTCETSQKLVLLTPTERFINYIIRADSLMDFYRVTNDVDNQDFLYLFKEYFSGDLSVERVAKTLRSKIIGSETGPIYEADPIENLLKIIPFIFFDKVDNHEAGFDFYYLSHGMYYFNMVISTEISYNNQLFTILHMLGHVLSDIIEDDRENIEVVLDHLACLVLIPSDELLEHFSSFKMDKFDEFNHVFNSVSEKYYVTYKTIAKSLYFHEIINEDEVVQLINMLATKNNDLSYNERKHILINIHIDDMTNEALNDGRINKDYLEFMTNGTNSYNKMV